MLELLHLHKTFSGQTLPALHNVHVHFQQGEFCSIVGSNGSGKSTLLHTILGKIPLNQGSILLNQKAIHTLPLATRAKKISILTQDVNQGCIPEMTMLENLMLANLRGQKSHLKNYQQQKSRIEEQVAGMGLGLERSLLKPLSLLSGGQRQAIATLMTLVSQPELLLLDEHTSALDPQTQKQLMGYTAKMIQERHMTCLMVTHDLEDALRYGNRLLMMHHGQIILNIAGEEKKACSPNRLLELFYPVVSSQGLPVTGEA